MNTIEPLELRQQILREIDSAIVAIGGGQRIFPYPEILIHMLAGDSFARGVLRAAFVKNRLLEKTIHEWLREPRCNDARPIVRIVFNETISAERLSAGFEITFVSERVGETEGYLEVLEGHANRQQIRLLTGDTFIGRCAEAEATSVEPLRRNDLYFLDSRELTGRVSKDLKSNEKINQSVSRRHAHVHFNEDDGTYYLYDDGSSKGTTILRGGRGVAQSVPNKIGKELRHGDVIYLGKAKIRVRIKRI